MSDKPLPSEILQLIQVGNFTGAIAKCSQSSIPTEPVMEIIRNKLKKAASLIQTDPSRAMDIYISLIGVVEPSVVLCRFFAPHLSNYLARYLIELHKKGFAATQHTKLLFNLFHHENNRPLLNDFIEMLKLGKKQLENSSKKTDSFSLFQDSTPKNHQASYEKLVQTFDAISAVEVLRQNDMDKEALEISDIMNISTHKIAIMIQTTHKYLEAACAIEENAQESSGLSMLLEFGPTLLALSPEDQGEEVKQHIENAALTVWSSETIQAEPELLIKLFWGYPKSAVRILEKLLSMGNELFTETLIMLRIPIKNANENSFFGNPEVADESKAIELIHDYSSRNSDHLLFYCTEVGFTLGVEAILLKNGRFTEITAMLIQSNNIQRLTAWYQENKTSLSHSDIVDIFHFFIKQEQLDIELITDIVKELYNSNKVSLASLLDDLFTNPKIPFSVIRNIFEEQSTEISSKLQDEESEHSTLIADLQRLDNQIELLEQSDFEFKPMTCDLCKQELETPSICFFCKHHFHKRCVQSDENGNYLCPICHCTPSAEFKIPEEEKKILDTHAPVIDQVVTLVENGFFL